MNDPGTPVASVAEEALNGIQLQRLAEVLKDVSAGALAPENAIFVITTGFPRVDEEEARRAVATAAAFKPAPPAEGADPAAGA